MVQNRLNLNNVQRMLQRDYWEGEYQRVFGGYPNNNQQIHEELYSPEYWDRMKKNYPIGTGYHRSLGNIVTELAAPLLRELNTLGEDRRKLSLYRAMDVLEANNIQRWYGVKGETERILQNRETAKWEDREIAEGFPVITDRIANPQMGIIPVGLHLASYAQAQSYAGKPPSRIIRFVLKPGAHRLLFKPRVMAIGAGGQSVTRLLLRIWEEEEKNTQPRLCTAHEGTCTGYIGMKPENREPHSITIANASSSKLLFQLFIDRIAMMAKDEEVEVRWY
jgi:hypothetical protein